MNGNYITWNLVNWITVILMVAVGLAVVTGAASILRQFLPGTAVATAAGAAAGSLAS